MQISLAKINIFLSTLNFALCFVGYIVATSLFLPVSFNMEGISQTVTVPYRALALGISLLVLILNKGNSMKLTIPTKWYLLFWVLLLCRMLYDLEIRSDLFILQSEKNKLWMYALFICFMSTISVIKSSQKIDLDRAFRWVFFSLFGVLVLQLSTNAMLLTVASELTQRVDGNLAINTISFGHNAATSVILCISYYQRFGSKFWQKIFVVVVCLLSLFVMLRAGSRGPFLSLSVVLIFYFFARSSKRWVGIFTVLLLSLVVLLFSDAIMELIRMVSPVMYNRMESTLYGVDTGGREPLYEFAFNTFYDNPILGGQFCLVSGGITGYSHNSLLDMLMGLGLIGGGLFCYILSRCLMIAYKRLPSSQGNEWVLLILLQRIMAGMTSGAFYYDQLLTVLIGFIFMKYVGVKVGWYKIEMPILKNFLSEKT